MLVPGMYTTVMLYGESRPTTFPSQNQHIHEPSYNPDNARVLRPLWAHKKEWTILAMLGTKVFIVFSLFSLLSSENKPRTPSKLSTIFMIRWFQSTVLKKV